MRLWAFLGQQGRNEGESSWVAGRVYCRRSDGREHWVGLLAGFWARGAEGGRAGLGCGLYPAR